MAQFIFTSRNGIHIIDLQKTMQRLKIAYNAMKEIAEENGKVLFVGTKKQAQASVVEHATNCGMFYVAERWLGGLLTNFDTVSKSIQRLKELERMRDTDQWDAEMKKEILDLTRELEKKEKVLAGIKDMTKLPEALFIIDPKREAIAVKEARKLRIPIFAVIDTNCNPDEIDYPVPGNDDAIRAIALFLEVMSRAINEGKSAGQVEEEDAVDEIDEEAVDASTDEEEEGAVEELASDEAAKFDEAASDEAAVAETGAAIEETVESTVTEDSAVESQADSIEEKAEEVETKAEEEIEKEAAATEKDEVKEELQDKYQEEYGDLDEKDTW